MEKITLVDEENNEVEFLVYDRFEFFDNEYIILLPVDTPSYLYLLKYRKEDDTYIGIDDREEYDIVKNEYRKYRDEINVEK